MLRRTPYVYSLFLLLATATSTYAGPLAFTADDIGGGMFQYNLTLSNPFDVGLSGLNLFRAHSMFGLTGLSIIGAPQDVGHDPSADWAFFPPLEDAVDELNYFALSQPADVPPGATLSGFFFQSLVDPRTLPPDGLILSRDYDLIDATGHQIPEPSSLVLVSAGTMLLWGTKRRHR